MPTDYKPVFKFDLGNIEDWDFWILPDSYVASWDAV